MLSPAAQDACPALLHELGTPGERIASIIHALAPAHTVDPGGGIGGEEALRAMAPSFDSLSKKV